MTTSKVTQIFRGPRREPRQQKAQLKSRQRIFGVKKIDLYKNEGERTGKVVIRIRKEFLAVDETFKFNVALRPQRPY